MVREGYLCEVCGKASTDLDETVRHERIPIFTFGFKGGELISYGRNMGSGRNVALILEPTIIDENHQ